MSREPGAGFAPAFSRDSLSDVKAQMVRKPEVLTATRLEHLPWLSLDDFREAPFDAMHFTHASSIAIAG